MRTLAFTDSGHGLEPDWRESWRVVWQSYRFHLWAGLNAFQALDEVKVLYGKHWHDVLLDVALNRPAK